LRSIHRVAEARLLAVNIFQQLALSPRVAVVAPNCQCHSVYACVHGCVHFHRIASEIDGIDFDDSHVVVTQSWIGWGEWIRTVGATQDAVALPGFTVEVLPVLGAPGAEGVLQVVVPGVRDVDLRKLHLHGHGRPSLAPQDQLREPGVAQGDVVARLRERAVEEGPVHHSGSHHGEVELRLHGRWREKKKGEKEAGQHRCRPIARHARHHHHRIE
jgi:hypothetical protein